MSGRPPALSPAQQNQIAQWVTQGKTNGQMFAEAQALGWKAGRTAVGDAAKHHRAGRAVRANLPEQVPAQDQDRLAVLEAKVTALERLLAMPVDAAAVTIEEALAQGVTAVARQINRLDIDPRALPGLLKQLSELAKTVKELQGPVDDGPGLFQP